MSIDTEAIDRLFLELSQVTKATTAKEMELQKALDFLRRGASGEYRIVASGDLTTYQISEAQRRGLFYVEPGGGIGWALVPWDVTTTKDRKREADYFSRNNMMANTLTVPTTEPT